MSLDTNIKLPFFAIGVYITFMYWGYLQEKLNTTNYLNGMNEKMNWNYPLVLNLFMSSTCFLTAYTVERVYSLPPQKLSIFLFWKTAMSSAVASPLGYFSLKFIKYPLLILMKSSKPVPVMFVGVLFYKRQYPWFKYFSVIFLCIGIYLFSSASQSNHSSNDSELVLPIIGGQFYRLCFGMMLAIINLILDGFTSNEQDHVFDEHSATSLEMMKNTNLWQGLYQTTYLVIGLMFFGQQSELYQSIVALQTCAQIRIDVFMFCCCAAVGQLLIFGIIKQFGSLVWITISVTRQLFTILLSLVLFKHQLMSVQWFGMVLVFGGLIVEIVMTQLYKREPDIEDFESPMSPSVRSHLELADIETDPSNLSHSLMDANSLTPKSKRLVEMEEHYSNGHHVSSMPWNLSSLYSSNEQSKKKKKKQ